MVIIRFFQKSSSLKPLNQFEPNVTTIILRVSSLKFVSDVPADLPTWLPLLKVEHRDKINKKIKLKNLKNYVKVQLLPNFVEMLHL